MEVWIQLANVQSEKENRNKCDASCIDVMMFGYWLLSG